MVYNMTGRGTRQIIKTRKFSTLHIEIFEQVLVSGKTNRALNLQFGYTEKSHVVVDHSRKVMFKLLALENMAKNEFQHQIVYPRIYKFWWKKLLAKHEQHMLSIAIQVEYYKHCPYFL
jgi:hypothetical protein